MKKQIVFSGVGTALVTPFKNGKIDYSATAALIESQISAGIDALIIAGTTGEAATLSDYERYSLFEFTKEAVAGRVKLVFGVGTNDTKIAVRHARRATEIGCDALLAVTPYYNKGTHRGILEHYRKICGATDLSVILYNVPSRTGVDLTVSEICELSEMENVAAIKEAGDSMEKFGALASLSDSIGLYAGNDSHTYQVLSLGGLGVISVLSNLCPAYVKKICTLFFEGDKKGALALQSRTAPLVRALFSETNPAPVKYLMQMQGKIENELRLPLAPVCEETAKKLEMLSRKIIGES